MCHPLLYVGVVLATQNLIHTCANCLLNMVILVNRACVKTASTALIHIFTQVVLSSKYERFLYRGQHALLLLYVMTVIVSNWNSFSALGRNENVYTIRQPT